MKPSDKILASAIRRGGMEKDNVISAILDYLDEEYAKKHNHEVGTKCSQC